MKSIIGKLTAFMATLEIEAAENKRKRVFEPDSIKIKEPALKKGLKRFMFDGEVVVAIVEHWRSSRNRSTNV